MDKDFKKGTQKINNAIQDANLLRYLVTDSQITNSPVIKCECQYIYVKPGKIDNEISNIDFVQAVYAENGINLKKRTSMREGKTVEVLYIATSDILKLSNTAKSFLQQTAPVFDDKIYAREAEIANKMLFSKDRIISGDERD